MKGFFCFALLLLAAICQGRIVVETEEELQNVDSQSTDEGCLKDIRKPFEKRCQAIGHEIPKKKFNNAVEIAIKCIEDHVPLTEDGLKALKDGPLDNLCSKKRVSLRKCFKDVIEVAEECFNDDERYLPEFIIAAFDGIFELICDSEKILDEIFTEDTMKCIETIVNDNSVIEDNADFEEFLVFTYKLTEELLIVKKNDLCHDLNATNKLFNKIITTSCPDNVNLHSIIDKIHRAISSPCLLEPRTK